MPALRSSLRSVKERRVSLILELEVRRTHVFAHSEQDVAIVGVKAGLEVLGTGPQVVYAFEGGRRRQRTTERLGERREERSRAEREDNSQSTSWQFPPGASPHLSEVICMRPDSPPPPVTLGLQVPARRRRLANALLTRECSQLALLHAH